MSLQFLQTAPPADLLKVCLAACSSSKKPALPFALTVIEEAPSNFKKALFFRTQEGHLLFEPNSIARYLCKNFDDGSAAERAKIAQWLELEEGLAMSEAPFEALLAALTEHMASQPSLIQGKKNTFADMLLWSHFFCHFTLINKGDLKKCSQNVARWYEHHASLQIYQDASRIFEKELLPLIKIVKKAPKVEALPPQLKTKEGISINIEKRGEILPVEGERNILITSALPYVNNVPHLGNIIGCVLSADVYARYCRLKGYNTLYVCGTDEYGTATETKALEENMTCQEICDKYHALHKQIYEWFEIDFDKFGRTTTQQQTDIAQDIFLRLHKNNLLLEEAMVQLWCEKCERFLADRYVEGTCPHPGCGYEDARGDQCDKCGKLVNAEELIKPKCKICSTAPIKKESNHMFLNLPELQDKCEKWVDKSYTEGAWSSNGYVITQNWFKEGLKPRCITRDLKWGTPVPLENMKNKVFYVWFDAPIGYVSITANYTKSWEKWWKNPDQVKLYQFMGKDNVPFHTVIFPCSLIGADDNYTLLHHVSTTEYLNYESGKFSKSRKVGVFGNDVMDTGIPVSVWRFCLLINRPESNDSQFSWNDVMLKNNAELLANIGNFVNRTLKFLKAKFRGQLQEVVLTDEDKALFEQTDSILEQYSTALESVKIREGLRLALELSANGNLYLANNKLDNTLFESNRQRCGSILTIAINLIYYLATLLYPYMPSTSKSINEQLHAPLRKLETKFSIDLLPGHVIGNPVHLFSRIEEDVTNKLRDRFKGTQGDVPEPPKKGKKGPQKPAQKQEANSGESSSKPQQQPKKK